MTLEGPARPRRWAAEGIGPGRRRRHPVHALAQGTDRHGMRRADLDYESMGTPGWTMTAQPRGSRSTRRPRALPARSAPSSACAEPWSSPGWTRTSCIGDLAPSQVDCPPPEDHGSTVIRLQHGPLPPCHATDHGGNARGDEGQRVAQPGPRSAVLCLIACLIDGAARRGCQGCG
jgi:hypothetical protein